MTIPVTVRYWAGARARAGVDSEVLDRPAGSTVGAALDQAAAAHPGLDRVLAVASVLIDGRTADPAAVLEGPVTLEVLPPFAGG